MGEVAQSYVVRIGSKAYNVTVQAIGSGKFKVSVDGTELEVLVETGRQAAPAEPTPSLRVSRPAEAKTAAPSPQADVEEAKPRTQPVHSPQSSAATAPATHATSVAPATSVAGALIVAPIPGKVLKVFVAPGDLISPGKLVATLESMKMGVEIFSDKSGRVKEVRVKPGDFINVGDPLVVLE